MISELLSKHFLSSAWARAGEDDMLGRSAQLSYYFLLSLFPLLFFLLTLFGYFSGAGSRLRGELIRYLSSVLPSSALQLVTITIDEVNAGRGGGKLSIGLLMALWAASNGMIAIGESLNAAYEMRETRSWWKIRIVSLALTIAIAALVISSLLIVLFGGDIVDFVAASIAMSGALRWVWKVLQWPLALIFVLVGVSLIYRYAPNLRDGATRISGSDYRRRWLSPGAIIAVILWLAVSLGFRVYLHFFNSYGTMYGSLGALIVLMLWFYLTGAAMLFGAEINCEADVRKARAG